jgi:ribosomal protein S18 acetylase RimI-like enzyme
MLALASPNRFLSKPDVDAKRASRCAKAEMGDWTSAHYQNYLGPIPWDPARANFVEDNLRAEVEPCAWDTEFFGFSFARVKNLYVREPLPEKTRLAAYLCEAHYRFADVRVGATHSGIVDLLLNAGFRRVEEMAIFTLPNAVPSREEAVTPAQPGDREHICRLAAESFSTARFFQDARFPRDKVTAFYAQLAEHFLGHGDLTVVLRTDKQFAGFALGTTDPELSKLTGRRIGYLWLVAVAPGFRGKGFGLRLLHGFHHYFAQYAEVIEVGTQTVNEAALRLYRKYGCRNVAGAFTLHWWNDDAQR